MYDPFNMVEVTKPKELYCPKCNKEIKNVWCVRGIPTQAGLECDCGFKIQVADGGYEALYDLFNEVCKSENQISKESTHILDKFYKYLLSKEKFWDACAEECVQDKAIGTSKHLQAMLCSSFITEIRIYLEYLLEGKDET